jgi:hypothetical protein
MRRAVLREVEDDRGSSLRVGKRLVGATRFPRKGDDDVV